MGDRYSNHSIKIHHLAETAVTVGLLSSLGHDLNSEITAPETGDPYDVGQVITMQKPVIPFGTLCLKSILDKVGLTGKAIGADGSHPGFVAYAQKHDPAGTNGRASSNHMSVTVAAGQLVIESLGGSAGQDATITCKMNAKATDVSTAPYVVAYNATLPASPTKDERYAIGKAIINGFVVDRIKSQQVDYNPVIELSEDADSIWPTLVDIQKIRTLVTIVTESPHWLSNSIIPGVGTYVGANSWINFIRREITGTPVSGGVFKDFTDTNHIRGTLNAGLIHVSQHYAASGGGVNTTTIQIAGIETGGVAPITWDTASVYDNDP